MGKEAVLQTGQELEQVASFGEAKWRSLDAILADQHHSPSTVNCRDTWDRMSLFQSLMRVLECISHTGSDVIK